MTTVEYVPAHRDRNHLQQLDPTLKKYATVAVQTCYNGNTVYCITGIFIGNYFFAIFALPMIAPK